jgi:DNA-binding transcriptional MerR regulator
MRGTFTLNELVAEFRVSQRTIYRYMQRGLLPRPIGPKRTATYTMEHYRRLREIQRAKDEAVTLLDLCERFAGTDSADVA